MDYSISNIGAILSPKGSFLADQHLRAAQNSSFLKIVHYPLGFAEKIPGLCTIIALFDLIIYKAGALVGNVAMSAYSKLTNKGALIIPKDNDLQISDDKIKAAATTTLEITMHPAKQTKKDHAQNLPYTELYIPSTPSASPTMATNPDEIMSPGTVLVTKSRTEFNHQFNQSYYCSTNIKQAAGNVEPIQFYSDGTTSVYIDIPGIGSATLTHQDGKLETVENGVTHFTIRNNNGSDQKIQGSVLGYQIRYTTAGANGAQSWVAGTLKTPTQDYAHHQTPTLAMEKYVTWAGFDEDQYLEDLGFAYDQLMKVQLQQGNALTHLVFTPIGLGKELAEVKALDPSYASDPRKMKGLRERVAAAIANKVNSYAPLKTNFPNPVKLHICLPSNTGMEKSNRDALFNAFYTGNPNDGSPVARFADLNLQLHTDSETSDAANLAQILAEKYGSVQIGGKTKCRVSLVTESSRTEVGGKWQDTDSNLDDVNLNHYRRSSLSGMIAGKLNKEATTGWIWKKKKTLAEKVLDLKGTYFHI